MAERLLPGIGFVPDSRSADALIPGIGFAQDTGGGAALADALGLAGPASGMAGYASEDFTITVNGPLSGSKVVTPDDGGQGGTFAPPSVTLTAEVLGANFTYTAASAGSKTITVTASGLTSDSVTFVAAAYVAPPSISVASVVIDGDDVTVNFNLADQTDSGVASLNATSGGTSKPPQSITIDNDANTGTVTFVDCDPGTYSAAGSATNVIDTANVATPSNIVIGEISGEIGGGGQTGQAATAVTLTGATSGYINIASPVFTVGANGTISGTVTITPASSAGSGTFSPASVSISSAQPTATFTYTGTSLGSRIISVTNDGSLTTPSSITYLVLDTVSVAARARRRSLRRR